MSFITRQQWAQFVRDNGGNPVMRTIQDLEQLDATASEALALLTPQLNVDRGGTGHTSFPVGAVLIGNDVAPLLTFSTTTNRSLWGAGAAGIDDDAGFTRTGDAGRYLFGSVDNTADKVQINGGLLAGLMTFRANVIQDEVPSAGLALATRNASVAGSAGGDISLTGGNGLSTGNGASLFFTAGAAGSTGQGGGLSFVAGNGPTTKALLFFGGAASAGVGSDIQLVAGPGGNGGGLWSAQGGAGTGAASIGGAATLTSGDSSGVGASPGDVTIAAGVDLLSPTTTGKIFLSDSQGALATSYFDPSIDTMFMGVFRPTIGYKSVDGTDGITFGASAIVTLTVKNGLIVGKT